MYSDHIDYYLQAVLPDFENYVIASKSENTIGGNGLVNAAIKSAGSLFHFRDYLLNVFGETFSRKHVVSLCPEFDIIGDVYNSTKHKDITRKDKIIANSNSIKKAFYASRFHDQYGLYTVCTPVVIIEPIKGEQFDLLKPSTVVFNFWAKLMFDNKFINKAPYYRYEGDDIIPRGPEHTGNGRMKAEMPKYKTTENILLVVRTYDYNLGKFLYK